MTQKKEPLYITVETGYMISDLAIRILHDVPRIEEHIRESERKLVEAGNKVGLMDYARAMRLINDVKSAAYGLKEAHKILSDVLENKLGYEAITKDHPAWSGVINRD